MMGSFSPTLSLVIPAYNEEENIAELYKRVTTVLESLDITYEVIFMDNHSRDATPELMKEITARDKRWKYVRLSRNFGYQLNISAGISYASGKAIVVMDADLQDPPELIGDFVRWWRQDYDIVYGVREERLGEPLWRKVGMKLYYRMVNKLSPLELPLDAGDFRLISRRVQRELLKFQESSRYLRGIYAYVGFRQKGIPYERQARHAGTSNFSLLKMIGLGLDGIISFSMVPIRVLMLVGLVMLLGAVAFTAFAIQQRLAGITPPGWATITILMLGLSGIQITFLGLIGEYVGRTYIEAKRRPLWIVEEEINVDREQPPRGAAGLTDWSWPSEEATGVRRQRGARRE